MLTTSISGPLSAEEASWPRFLGNGFNGVGVTGDRVFDWSRLPKMVWSLDVGEGYGLGSIAGENYFQFDTDRAGRNERLRCIDFDSGKVKWEMMTPFFYRDLLGYEAGPRSTPTVSGDRVYTFGVTGILNCHNRDDGKKVWSVDTNKKFGVVQNFFGVGSSPLIVGDKIIVAVGGSPPEDQRIAPGALDRVAPNGSALVAFRLTDGELIWKTGKDLASYSSPRIAKLAGKDVVLYFARAYLLAVDPKDGTELWKKRHRASILESVNAMVPIVDGDKVFISECYQVGSTLLDLSSGEPETVWLDPAKDRRNQAMRCHWSTPALIDGYLYGCSGRNNPDSDFRCVELATGKVMWIDDQNVRSSVVRVGKHLVIWSERGRMQVINPNPNEMDVVAEWDFAATGPGGDAKARLLSPCWAAPIVVGDRMLIRGDRKVICLRLATK